MGASSEWAAAMYSMQFTAPLQPTGMVAKGPKQRAAGQASFPSLCVNLYVMPPPPVPLDSPREKGKGHREWVPRRSLLHKRLRN